MNPHPDRPDTWPGYRPLFIAHDVGRTRDRSTAVIGRPSPFQTTVTGIVELHELPQNLFGSARASALAAIDRQHQGFGLIVADLSHDPTYAESLFDTFGPRVIGLQIGRHGDGMGFEWRPVRHSAMLVYSVGRSYLLELLHTQLQARLVRFVDGPMSRKAYGQLAGLERELRETGVVYSCPSGQHDDLGISCAMLVWASHHAHQERWFGLGFQDRQPRQQSQQYGWEAFT